MITVILVCWKRFENFEKVIKSWLAQDKVSQVIIWDNSGSFKTELPLVLVVSSSQNLGPTAKFSLAQLAKTDLILYADDDVVAKPGLIKDLLKHWADNKMIGVHGRKFTGTNYYNSSAYYANKITEPVRVNYLCGLIMLASKKYSLSINLSKCPDWFLIEDWWWQREIGIELWIAPTKNYEYLPESKDKNALHLTPEIKKIREKYYIEWILKGYREYFKPRYQRSTDDLLVGRKGLVGAEIGTYEGHHAREMFERLDIAKLYLIDPYAEYVSTLSPHLQKAKAEARKVLKEFEDKVIFVYEKSIEAAKKIANESLDFVYIDGEHSYEAVKQDISAWFPKVKKGGIVGGHDYTSYFPGTMKAVDEFSIKNKIKINIKYGEHKKGDPLTNRDWWFIK